MTSHHIISRENYYYYNVFIFNYLYNCFYYSKLDISGTKADLPPTVPSCATSVSRSASGLRTTGGLCSPSGV